MSDPAAPVAGWAERRARPADARACYRYILGRDEADEGRLARHAEAAGTIGALRGRFLGSEEFRQSLFEGAAMPEGRAPEVEMVAGEAELDAMVLRARRIWAALGDAAPHWSVLPEDRFRPERIEENRRAFQASGAAEAAGLLAALARCGVTAAEVPRLVEHGSGVGRVTPHLAAHFPEVACVDVSPPHLALARAELKRRGLVHLRFLRAKEGEPMPGPERRIRPLVQPAGAAMEPATADPPGAGGGLRRAGAAGGCGLPGAGLVCGVPVLGGRVSGGAAAGGAGAAPHRAGGGLRRGGGGGDAGARGLG
jgi:hypothetical protein